MEYGAWYCCWFQSRELSIALSFPIERVRYISNIVPILDSVAKKKRTLLGSRTHEGEDRLKLFLLMHLLSGVAFMLPVVIVIWWWSCGLLEWSAVPTVTTAAFSGVLGPLGEAEATIASLSLTERWERLEFIFFSPPPPPRGDPFLEWLLCNFFHSKQNHYKGNQIIQTK